VTVPVHDTLYQHTPSTLQGRKQRCAACAGRGVVVDRPSYAERGPHRLLLRELRPPVHCVACDGWGLVPREGE